MALHRIESVTIGVPDVASSSAYYLDFGLRRAADGWFETVDGGRQLRLVHSDRRRLVSMSIGADDLDDVGRVDTRLRDLDVETTTTSDSVSATEPLTKVVVTVRVSPQIGQPDIPAPTYNTVGQAGRVDNRAAVLGRSGLVRPRKLGHVVLGSTDQEATQRFFTDGIGLKVSDEIKGEAAFMRCSQDHHNVLVQSAPVTFLHHTSWQVEDIDEIGRGATHMLDGHPERHVWGLGRHYIGSNFFWYLKDPAGNYSEYYSDMDCVVDAAVWKRDVWGEAQSLYTWGPPPPPSFLHPDDLAGLMAGLHAS